MTELTVFQQKLASALNHIELRFNEPMHKHTSFRIGGGAEAMAFPKNREELALILKTSALLDVKPAILGAGTNVLAPDAGIPGLVVCLKDCLDGMELLENNRIRVMAGVTMTRAALFAANQNLGGMEFAHGIPGTVGGGVYMNAGAYGGELSQVVTRVDAISLSDGKPVCFQGGELGFSYRHSAMMDADVIVTDVVMQLTPCDPDAIRARMDECARARREKQPLNFPSAGSTFKRPAGTFAAKLIDDCGLRGLRIGDAQVSEKHTGFVVNLGQATAHDILALMDEIKSRVYEATGVTLDPEVRILGED